MRLFVWDWGGGRYVRNLVIQTAGHTVLSRFCVFADISLAIVTLGEAHPELKKFMIIDLVRVSLPRAEV